MIYGVEVTINFPEIRTSQCTDLPVKNIYVNKIIMEPTEKNAEKVSIQCHHQAAGIGWGESLHPSH